MKKTKLEIELEKDVKDYEKIKEILDRGTTASKYFYYFDDVTFRKLYISGYFNSLKNDQKTIEIISNPVYKEDIEKFYNKTYFYNYNNNDVINLSDVLKIHGDLKLSEKVLLEFHEKGYDINFDDKLKKWLLKNPSHISKNNIEFIEDSITKDYAMENLCYLHERTDKVFELLTFEEYVNTYNKNHGGYHEVQFHAILKYNHKEVLDYLLKCDKNINLVQYDIIITDKISINKKQAKQLIGKCGFNSLMNLYKLPFVEETANNFIQHQSCADYSEEINKMILDNKLDMKKYYHDSFEKINLSDEAVKILYKNKKISFSKYKKLLSSEEIEKIVNGKKEVFSYIFNKLKKSDKQIDYNCNNNSWFSGPDFGCSDSKSRKLERLLFNLVEQYELDCNFIFQAMSKNTEKMEPILFLSMMLENEFYNSRCGRW